MKMHIAILSLFALFAFSGCNKIILSGNNITKEFDIEGTYTELQVENAFDVTVSDAVDVISVTADENIMPKVIVEKSGNKLKIYLKGLNLSNIETDLKVVIPYNADLTSVSLSGASKFHTAYSLMEEEVEVSLSGASEFYGDLNAQAVTINMSGASGLYGDVNGDGIKASLSGGSNIEGKVTGIVLELKMSGASEAALIGQIGILNIDLSGGSSIVKQVVGNKYGLVCDQCEGEMSGASSVYIHCESDIEVSLSGGSTLHYTGNASTSGSDCSGGSNIVHDVL